MENMRLLLFLTIGWVQGAGRKLHYFQEGKRFLHVKVM